MSIKILVTSAGTASAVSVMKALRMQNEIPVHITAIDTDDSAAGLYIADEFALVPPASSPEYVLTLIDLCKKKEIKVIYPIHSKEIEIIASKQHELLAQGIKVMLATSQVISLCNDKTKMYEFVSKLGFLNPKTVKDPGVHDLPLFMKPNSGSGTTHTAILKTQDDLEYYLRHAPQSLYQEYIQGQEYTVDCFSSFDHQLIVASPRTRLAVKAGQAVKAQTEHVPQLIEYCEKLSSALQYVGPFNVQFIKKGNEFFFVEMNPRFAAGGLMLTVKAGANIPLLVLKAMLGERIDAPKITPGILMIRYWEELFIERSSNGTHRI